MTSSDSEDSDGPRGEQQAGTEKYEGEGEEQTDTYADDFEAHSNHDDEAFDGSTARAENPADEGTGPDDGTCVRLSFRPESPAVPSQQLSFADGVIGTERPQTAAPRQASGRRQGSAQLSGRAPHSPVFIAAYGSPPGSPPASHPTHSGHLTTTRYANGLPLRKPTGPLPGMPFLSDLVSRYPVRQAPPTGPEVSLISGQLFVNDRLRGLVSRRRHPETEGLRPHSYVLAQSWTGQPLVPVYGRGAGGGGGAAQGLVGTYLEARRQEREQRATLSARPAPKAADTPGELGGGAYHSRPWGSYPGGGGADVTGSSSAGASGSQRPPAADADGAGAGAAGGGGGGGGGAGAGSQEHVRRASVERWLESSDKASEGTDGGAGRSSSQAAASEDPSLVYRQYSIYRTYAGYGVALGVGAGAGGAGGGVMGRRQHGQPLRPSTSLPVLSRAARRPGYDQRRGSGDAGSGSPARPLSRPVNWSPQRARAW